MSPSVEIQWVENRKSSDACIAAGLRLATAPDAGSAGSRSELDVAANHGAERDHRRSVARLDDLSLHARGVGRVSAYRHQGDLAKRGADRGCLIGIGAFEQSDQRVQRRRIGGGRDPVPL